MPFGGILKGKGAGLKTQIGAFWLGYSIVNLAEVVEVSAVLLVPYWN